MAVHQNSLSSTCTSATVLYFVNPLNAELNPICHSLVLLGAHHIFHISRIRVKFRGYQKKSPCRRFIICKKKTCTFATLLYFVKFRGFVCGVCSSSRCVWGLETLAVFALKTVNCRKMYQRFYWTFFCCEVWGTSFILNVGANASYTASLDTINSNNLHMICLRSIFRATVASIQFSLQCFWLRANWVTRLAQPTSSKTSCYLTMWRNEDHVGWCAVHS